ncbi:DUF1961 family protein [Asticcacaulis solisilvae]|uniref:DUF1961 family protein n=1 Tax=Asticcacaulis solisilvae TaxID=1217274 RepID=UPI003FD6E8BD
MDRRQLIASGAAFAALAGGASAQPVQAPAAPKLERIYYNPLKSAGDVKDWVMEGQVGLDFDTGAMRMHNLASADKGQEANFVFWCPEVFPDDIEIRWNFTALEEPGLCILFFAARGILPGGGDCHVLDKRLKPRAGVYDQYTKSDVSALQIAYFRRRWPEERAFHLSNLRRAPGFELLAQGADPLPDVKDATPPYRIRMRKSRAGVQFFINDLKVVEWAASGANVPGQGSIGFRQMAPLVAKYSEFEVFKL